MKESYQHIHLTCPEKQIGSWTERFPMQTVPFIQNYPDISWFPPLFPGRRYSIFHTNSFCLHINTHQHCIWSFHQTVVYIKNHRFIKHLHYKITMAHTLYGFQHFHNYKFLCPMFIGKTPIPSSNLAVLNPWHDIIWHTFIQYFPVLLLFAKGLLASSSCLLILQILQHHKESSSLLSKLTCMAPELMQV